MTTPLTGRPTFAAIDAAALRDNSAAVRAAVPAHVAVLAVVKANARRRGIDLDDDVVRWGSQNGAEISVSEVAARQGTIAYEVLTGIGRRVPRIWR